MSRTRTWCFTLHNYTTEEEATLCALPSRYLVYGRERCPSTDVPHLQGYVVLLAASTLSALKGRLAVSRIHLEASKGTSLQNRLYCIKEGSYIEQGERPLTAQEKGESERLRWTEARRCAELGELDKVPDDIFIRYIRNLEHIGKRSRVTPEPRGDVTGLWIVGQTGTGKSRFCIENYPGAYYKAVNKWWDGYADEEVAVIEDVDKRHSDFIVYFLKIWGDRYPFRAEVKGGSLMIRPTKVIITSNYHPEELWTEQSDLEPILRRFEVKLM